MPPAVVEPQASLTAEERSWLQQMGAILDVDLGAAAEPSSVTPTTTPQSGDAGDPKLTAQIEQLKAAIIPRVKEALTADPSKKDEIKQLLEGAASDEKSQSFGEAAKKLRTLAETVKTALTGIDEKLKYEAALPGIENKVRTLKDHPRASAIAAEVTQVNAALKEAKEKATKANYTAANKELAKIEKIYPEAMRHAKNTDITRKQEERLQIQFENLKQHQGIGLIGEAKVKAVGDKLTQLNTVITNRQWDQYDALATDIGAKIAALKERANYYGDYLGLRNNSLLLVKALEGHPNKDAIAADIATIKKDFIEKAKTEYEANSDPATEVARYTKAKDLLKQVEPKYKTAIATADGQGKTKYDDDVKAARLKLKALDTTEKQSVVGKEITDIKTKLDTADKRAGVKQFAVAMALVTEATKACEEAEKTAKKALEYKKADKTAGDAVKNGEKDPKAAVEAVQKLHGQLKSHSQAAAISVELAAIQKKIDQAKGMLGK